MKQLFEPATVEIVKLDTVDVIATSDPDSLNINLENK